MLVANSHTAPWAPPDNRGMKRRAVLALGLAVAAGLLDVPPEGLGPGGGRLLQRHLHRHLVDADVEPCAQPGQDEVEMGRAGGPQHHLAGRGVVLDPQGRVLGREFTERSRHPVLVSA